MTIGQAFGLLMMFCISLVPAGLFGGVLLGSALRFPIRTRYAITFLLAAIMAYGAVYHIGPALDDDCVERTPNGSGRC